MEVTGEPPTIVRPRRTRRSLRAVLMRAGTSKGLFIHRADLPESESEWAEPLLAAMGSRLGDPRQLDGIGGATSVTSKVAVVAPSTRPGVDVDYTFVQVSVGSEKVDLSGNCGNMVSGVGPFAVQEGLVAPPPPGSRTMDVSVFNTNTSRLIVETVSVDEETGELLEEGECVIPGVKGPASEIKVAFVEPAGSMTGKLFPSGKRAENITVEAGVVAGLEEEGAFTVDVTLVDAANPFVVVDARTLPLKVQEGDAESPLNMAVAEAIRQRGAVLMGLAESTEAASLVRGTPKLAVVSKPEPLTGDARATGDIFVQAYSMGKPHPSLQLTGGVCLAGAVCMEGTVLHRLANLLPKPVENGDAALALTPQRTPSPSQKDDDSSGDEKEKAPAASVREEQDPFQKVDVDAAVGTKQVVKLQHGRGVMAMEVWKKAGEDGLSVERCIGVRTARRLFEGKVLYYA